MQQRKEKGFTLDGILTEQGNAFNVQLVLSDNPEKREAQLDYLRGHVGRIIKLGREKVRHPDP